MECFSIKALDEIISELQPGDWFIVDIDDTLIAPQAMMFRPQSPHHKFIDDLKKTKPQNIAEILSTWRFNRRVVLVEAKWPEIIKQLKAKGVTVLGLTQMNSGSFGHIASMEKWRAAELAKLDLTFSPFATDDVEIIIENDEPATLYQGILFTGSHPKDETLKAFINKYPRPNRVVFIDDRLHQVELLAKFCKAANISYHGYHYLGASKLPYETSKDCGAIQTKMIANCQWAEDEDACQMQSNAAW